VDIEISSQLYVLQNLYLLDMNSTLQGDFTIS